MKIRLAEDSATPITIILGEDPNTVAVRLAPGGSVTVEATEEAAITITGADLSPPGWRRCHDADLERIRSDRSKG